MKMKQILSMTLLLALNLLYLDKSIAAPEREAPFYLNPKEPSIQEEEEAAEDLTLKIIKYC